MDIVILMLCPSSVDTYFPTLEVFEASLNGAWKNLVQWKVALPTEQGSLGPFQPKPFYDSMIILAFK